MNTRISWILVGLITLGVFAGTALVYNRLPDPFPIHWNLQGQADRFGTKFWAVWLMPCAMLVLALVFAALPWLSPRKFSIDTFRGTYQWIVVLVTALMAAIHAFSLIQAMGSSIDFGRVLLGLVFVFFALFGNVMGKVRRNFFVGIRVPWTLASERVWNDTHRLAAWLWVAAGLVGLGLSWLPSPWYLSGFGVLAVAVIVPIVYSLYLYKKLERAGELS